MPLAWGSATPQYLAPCTLLPTEVRRCLQLDLSTCFAGLTVMAEPKGEEGAGPSWKKRAQRWNWKAERAAMSQTATASARVGGTLSPNLCLCTGGPAWGCLHQSAAPCAQNAGLCGSRVPRCLSRPSEPLLISTWSYFCSAPVFFSSFLLIFCFPGGGIESRTMSSIPAPCLF